MTVVMAFLPVLYSNSRPDEEGIKTEGVSLDAHELPIPTADLMKKGLRPYRASASIRPTAIPTADLMKKGLRPAGGSLFLLLQ